MPVLVLVLVVGFLVVVVEVGDAPLPIPRDIEVVGRQTQVVLDPPAQRLQRAGLPRQPDVDPLAVRDRHGPHGAFHQVGGARGRGPAVQPAHLDVLGGGQRDLLLRPGDLDERPAGRGAR
jgi:hypothetical protein